MPVVTNWDKLESNPGVISYLIKELGVKGIQAENLSQTDQGAFQNLKHAYGFIVKFQHSVIVRAPKPEATGDSVKDIYFAKQVINNACVTQAVINILMNIHHPHVDLGPGLLTLKQCSMRLNPQMRGITICNFPIVRAAHNFMKKLPLYDTAGMESPEDTRMEDTFRYVAFMPISGRIYEFDGLCDGPIDHGSTGEDWLETIRSIIVDKINNETRGQVYLMPLVHDMKLLYEEQINQLLEADELDPMEEKDLENEIRNLKMLIDFETSKMLV